LQKESARKKSQCRSVKGGLEKIAYGKVNDAVSLLFTDEADIASLREMDLYSIAEIKRQKGGAVEIKFYDRMEAMKCLRELEEKGESGSPLYRALEKCADSFGGDGKHGA